MRIRLVTYPQTDDRLRDAADTLLQRGADTPERLEAELREQYPRVRVVLGVLDGTERRWYVYRDGRWTNPEREKETSVRN